MASSTREWMIVMRSAIDAGCAAITLRSWWTMSLASTRYTADRHAGEWTHVYMSMRVSWAMDGSIQHLADRVRTMAGAALARGEDPQDTKPGAHLQHRLAGKEAELSGAGKRPPVGLGPAHI